MKYKKTIWEDMECPLYEMERAYLRKPMTIWAALIFPIMFLIIWGIMGICKAIIEDYYFVKSTWNGTPNDRHII